MNRSIKAVLVATTLALPLAAPVVAQDTSTMADGQSMLVDGLENNLQRMCIDTSGINDLTLNQIAEIRGILERDESSDELQRDRIQGILDS